MRQNVHQEAFSSAGRDYIFRVCRFVPGSNKRYQWVRFLRMLLFCPEVRYIIRKIIVIPQRLHARRTGEGITQGLGAICCQWGTLVWKGAVQHGLIWLQDTVSKDSYLYCALPRTIMYALPLIPKATSFLIKKASQPKICSAKLHYQSQRRKCAPIISTRVVQKSISW